MGNLLTTRQAASRLGVPVSTFLKWVTENRIPVAQKLPGTRGQYLYDPDAIAQLELSARVVAPPVIEEATA